MVMLASGYEAVEAPCVDGGGNLYFSDTIGGGVSLLGVDGRVEVVGPKRRGAGGRGLHAAGGIAPSGRDLPHIDGGRTRVLLPRDDVRGVPGTRVGGFNDITADRAGR